MRKFQNAVAVVTGAGSGIGRELALGLAARGAHLAICDIGERGLAETAAMLPSTSRVLARVVDVSKLPQMEAFANDVLAEFGRVSIVINNAGVALLGTAEELSLEDYEWIVGVNLWGPIYGTKIFLPHLRSEPEAHVAIVSSVFGIVAPAGQTAYALTKFAVRGFGESLRAELADSKIGVTVVHPGGIATNIARATRAGAHADCAEVARTAAFFDGSLARTSPKAAAAAIIRGIEKRKRRVLIGFDAHLIAALARFAPFTIDLLASRKRQEQRRAAAERRAAKSAARASRRLARPRA
jgi:NAD(P)-dependent dehydrogenase (short-subunit alcohol dehydrogenase family)